MIKATIVRFIFMLCAVLTSLTACSQAHIPLGGYRIQNDKFDTRLHGQEIYFTKSMSYARLVEKDIKAGWVKEIVEVGRYLQKSGPDGLSPYILEPEEIKDGTKFTIQSSFWHKKDWFESDLNGNIHYLLMIDENGVESVTSFTTLRLSSRKELKAFREEWEFRD